MGNWYVDEGLGTLIKEWKKKHPGSTVYTIANAEHSQNPRVSQHAPDDGKSGGPGDDIGEVDAADFMPGNGVSESDLLELWNGLHAGKDKRLFYVIHHDQIYSAVTQPWVIRHYDGKYHDHVHVSVNDLFDDNESDWNWEKMVARTVKLVEVNGKLPADLMKGDDDSVLPGYHAIGRCQALANWLDNTSPDVDTDGVYGPATAAKFGKAFKMSGPLNKLTHDQIKGLHGIGA